MEHEQTENNAAGGQSRSNERLGHWRIDVPVMGMDDEKDERSDGVVLLEVFDDENKTTAEDRGSYWYLRDWELTEVLPGTPYWFCRRGYAIDKDMIAKLSALGKCPNVKVSGLAPHQGG